MYWECSNHFRWLLERGIHVHVNGAGGHGHDETSGTFTGFFKPISGTAPQFAQRLMELGA